MHNYTLSPQSLSQFLFYITAPIAYGCKLNLGNVVAPPGYIFSYWTLALPLHNYDLFLRS